MEEGTSYRTTAFRVNGKLFARFHQDGDSLVIKVEYAAREVLMGANPETFYITDHYRCWPYMLIRVSRVRRDELKGVVNDTNTELRDGPERPQQQRQVLKGSQSALKGGVRPIIAVDLKVTQSRSS